MLTKSLPCFGTIVLTFRDFKSIKYYGNLLEPVNI